MAIKGNEKEVRSYNKYVGLFNGNVIAVNPSKTELSKILGVEIDKDLEYTGVNDETGAKKVTLSFWIQAGNKSIPPFNVRFSLEDTVVMSKSGKTQYINNIGEASYADSEETLPQFYKDKGRTIRKAKKGEEAFYNF